MSVTVEKLQNEPILIATLRGEITSEDMTEMFNLSADLMGDENIKFYRITDARESTSNFQEMFAALRDASTGQPGSTTDSRLQTAFVGTSTWISFVRNAMANPKFGGLKLAAYESIEGALEHIRTQITSDESSILS